ncbi:MAG TPA: hypothetical protein VGF97_13860 [Rhizomicrobium sp.]
MHIEECQGRNVFQTAVLRDAIMFPKIHDPSRNDDRLRSTSFGFEEQFRDVVEGYEVVSVAKHEILSLRICAPVVSRRAEGAIVNLKDFRIVEGFQIEFVNYGSRKPVGTIQDRNQLGPDPFGACEAGGLFQRPQSPQQILSFAVKAKNQRHINNQGASQSYPVNIESWEISSMAIPKSDATPVPVVASNTPPDGSGAPANAKARRLSDAITTHVP